MSNVSFKTRYETSKPEITCLCLDVVGKYVSWIDISLIANDRFVAQLLCFLSMSLLRESTCDCIHEIVSKGMDPVAKTTLVESFMSVLERSGILKLPEVCCTCVLPYPGNVHMWIFTLSL